MITIIRISGDVKLDSDIRETLYRLKIRRKYACVVVAETKENLGMLKKVSNFVAYGEIKKEEFEKLVEKRGQLIDRKKKTDLKKAAETLWNTKLNVNDYEKVNLKQFFRLHPPRGGIESKKHFGVGKGVLGSHKTEINKLLERML